MNLKSMVLDHYDMIAAGLMETSDMEKIASHYGDQVYSAEETRRAKDTDYALVAISKTGSLTRKFLLNSLTNVQFCKGSFEDNGHKLPLQMRKHAAQGIALACHRYGVVVPEEIEKLASEAGPFTGPYYTITDADEREFCIGMTKTASSNCFAVNEDVSGNPFQAVPIDTEEQVKEAMLKVANDRKNIAFEYVVQMATNIIKRASDLNMAIPVDHPVHQIVNDRFSEFFEGQMSKRAAMTGNTTHRQAYQQLIKTASSSSPQTVAIAVEKLDRLSRLDFRWDKELLPPLESVMHIKTAAMEKIANDVIVVNSIEYPVGQVQSVVKAKEDILNDYLGEETVKNLQQNTKEVFTSLPPAHKQIIVSLLAGDL